jgi:hypothetical protein
MTHDELLAKINNLPEVIGLAEFKVRHDALLAVVKLHTPRKAYFGDDEIVCRACGSADIEWTYPCPTIQAIERELTNG